MDAYEARLFSVDAPTVDLNDSKLLPARVQREMRALLGLLREYHPDSYYHSHRVAAYVNYFAVQLVLSPEERIKLVCAALLHDIGKLRTPLEILDNASPQLPKEKYEEIKKHPQNGINLLSKITDDWLGEYSDGILCHHEKWDGTGYPKGLSGKEISSSGGIIMGADVIDVVTSDRSYKRALPYGEAISELRKYAGTQFNPEVVYSFLKLDCVSSGLEDLHDELKFCKAWGSDSHHALQPRSSHAQLTGNVGVAT